MPEHQDDCIFCQIAAGEVESDLVYADEQAVAFHDINPQAPTHVLIIPVRHLPSLASAGDEDAALLGHLQTVARRLAEEAGLQEGYRVVINCGAQGGQTVDHLHLHLLGGRALSWPPG